MFLSPLGERLGEGGNAKAVACKHSLTQPLPQGERSMSETCARKEGLPAYSAATARGRALTTEALPEVISSWIHL